MIFSLPGKKKHKKTDNELLAEFSGNGDLSTLGDLYSGYMHLVYGVCLKYLKTREESMDAVMQIFEKLVIEIPKQKIENFSSWLHVVTRNYCLMQLRSEKTRNEKLGEYMESSIIFMENEPDVHPLDETEPVIDMMLMDCIERLKDEQKECIRKFYFGSMCYNDIAIELKIDEKKVKSHLQNAKRNLKICLDGKHAEREQG
jgi:RNA polymerase sigma-70 factor, ECF subfamily